MTDFDGVVVGVLIIRGADVEFAVAVLGDVARPLAGPGDAGGVSGGAEFGGQAERHAVLRAVGYAIDGGRCIEGSGIDIVSFISPGRDGRHGGDDDLFVIVGFEGYGASGGGGAGEVIAEG